MNKEPAWIKFCILDVKKKTNNPSGLYAILYVAAEYNENYWEKKENNWFEEFREENELNEIPHINLFYEFQFKEIFKSLKKGYEGYYQRKWCDNKNQYIYSVKDLKLNKSLTNKILLNADKYLRSYHYSYSKESIGLDTSLV